MKWLILVRLILDLISQLPLDKHITKVEIETKVREVLQEPRVQEVNISATDWEELIPHIVAIVAWFIKRFA